MEWLAFRVRLRIDGAMPERALLKLKRAKIALYRVKKVQKTQLCLEVKRKDIQKVFAIYPKLCYNSNGYSPYTVTKVGEVGLLKAHTWAKNRLGLMAGGLAFCVLTLFADTLILGVDIVGTRAYTRDIHGILANYGVKPFTRYDGRNTDEICGEILKLNGVEYCSVQKSGLRLVVELRLAKFEKPTLVAGDMLCTRSGEIRAITVLRGTALKTVGDSVSAGERLVGGYFQTENGTQKTVEPIARAEIACVYESVVTAQSEEQAFATAYLQLCLGERDEMESKTITKIENGYLVAIEYTVIETVNL